MSTDEVIRLFGTTRAGVWLIKHVVAPLDRQALRLTRDRSTLTQRLIGSVALLTTIGRRSGLLRSTPVFYLRDGERVIVCNVNPGFEATNPWVLNLRANSRAQVQIDGRLGNYVAHEANTNDIDCYWPQLVRVWPAYQTHFDRGGQRTIFILEPDCSEGAKSAS